MAVMLLKSNDPKLSFHLKKNPAAGIAAKKMRQGALMGWYPHGNQQEYALFFRDNTDNSSFDSSGKNYTDITRYASTYFVFHSINTMFSSVLKLDNTQEEYTHSITIPTVQLRTERAIEYINNFIGLNITVNKLSEDIQSMALYSVTLEYTGTFNEFMMKTYILFYLLHADLFQSDLGYMEGMIEKVTNILTELKSEYFLWYMFKKNVICRSSTFIKLKSVLGNNSSDGPINMQFGGTQQQRKDYIDSRISLENDLVDVGCGEGYYLLPYAKKMRDKKITGIDVDSKLIDSISRKVEERKQGDRVELFKSMDAFYESYDNSPKDVICVEVIEHMPESDALELVVGMLTKINIKTLIITTPNRSFNQYYRTMEGFRHDDHHFEFDEEGFSDFMTTAMDRVWGDDKPNMSIEYEGVGDEVNGTFMSQSIVIKFLG